MIILVIAALILIAGIILVKKYDIMECEWLSGMGIVFIILGIVVLATGLIMIPAQRWDTMKGIAVMEAIRQTFELARDSGREIETTAIQIKVAEANSWLAEKKYYKQTITGWWIPAAINEVEPIR